MKKTRYSDEQIVRILRKRTRIQWPRLSGATHLAQGIWNDPRLLEIPAKTEDEPRYLMIGLINGKHWSAVITYRGTNIRLISVRCSRTEEVTLYES